MFDFNNTPQQGRRHVFKRGWTRKESALRQIIFYCAPPPHFEFAHPGFSVLGGQ